MGIPNRLFLIILLWYTGTTCVSAQDIVVTVHSTLEKKEISPNIYGRQVYTGLSPVALDVSAVPAGLYLLSLETPGGVKVCPVEIIR